MKSRIVSLFMATVFMITLLSAQSNRERNTLLNDYVTEDELVTMAKSLPFDKALMIFGDFSKKYLNKIVVDPGNHKKEIGVDVKSMYWLKAFESVLRANSLWYDEREEYFYLFSTADTVKKNQTPAAQQSPAAAAVTPVTPAASAPSGPAPDTTGKVILRTRDVKISSVFFSVDVVKSLSAGINWSYLYTGDTLANPNSTRFGGDFTSGVKDPKATTSSGSGSSGSSTSILPSFVGRLNVPSVNFTNITALVEFFQSNQLGDVISSPQVVVSSKQKGRIQVGQDFFITTRDFSGNVVQQPYSSGIIIEVTPTVYEENNIQFINLDINAERSTVSAGPLINKSSVKTFSVLLDGEETVIGGLYTTTESNERGGVPFLKDLPWWVLGLKYIFGYDKTTESKQELIILLRAEIVPSLEDRVADKKRKNENIIEQQRKAFDIDIQKRKPKK